MNILQHKSWHVRNRDNIERVRRDEENARKEEEERLRKVALAESEARTSLLRDRAKTKQRNEDTVHEENTETTEHVNKHINFFAEEEQGVKKDGTNLEHEKEQKAEKEKREKAVGLLKYLGQDSLETQAVKPWYYTGTAREQFETEREGKESDLKKKTSLDPMNIMRKYVNAQRKLDGREPEPPPKKKLKASRSADDMVLKKEDIDKSTPSRSRTTSSSSDTTSSSSDEESSLKRKRSKSKKHKHKSKKKHKKQKKSHKSDKSEKHRHHKSKKSKESVSSPATSQTKTMAQLRAERLKREQAERQKTQQLFAKLRGEKTQEEKEMDKVMDDRSRGYNSQFNPEYVRKPKKKKAYLDMI